jgi:uncharacterized membrane protein YraQ (UPF0718 family)
MHELTEILSFVLRETRHLLPWFLTAIALGVVSQRVALDVAARRAFRRRSVLAVLLTTCIGAFSPFCSFTVIPLVRRFLRVGVPLSAVMAFWVASPSMDPEIWALSAATFGIPIATARLIGALALSLGAGYLVLLLERRGMFTSPLRTDRTPQEAATCSASAPAAAVAAPVPATASVGAVPGAVPTSETTTLAATLEADPAPAGGCSAATPAPSCGSSAAAPAPSCGSATPDDDDGRPWRELAREKLSTLSARDIAKDFASDAIGLGKWLLLAILLEALIVRYVPAEVIASTVGGGGALAIPLSVAVSVPLYLNGVGAIPVVAGLLEQGMSASAAVTFLLGGALTTVPAIVAVRSVVNNRVFAVYLGVAVVGSMIVGFGTAAVL